MDHMHGMVIESTVVLGLKLALVWSSLTAAGNWRVSLYRLPTLSWRSSWEESQEEENSSQLEMREFLQDINTVIAPKPKQ